MYTRVPVIEIRSNAVQYIWEYVHDHLIRLFMFTNICLQHYNSTAVCMAVNWPEKVEGTAKFCARVIQGEAQESFLLDITNAIENESSNKKANK